MFGRSDGVLEARNSEFEDLPIWLRDSIIDLSRGAVLSDLDEAKESLRQPNQVHAIEAALQLWRGPENWGPIQS